MNTVSAIDCVVSLGTFVSKLFVKCTIHNVEKVIYQSRLYEGDMYRAEAKGVMERCNARLPDDEDKEWLKMLEGLDTERESLVLFAKYTSLASELAAVSKADKYRINAKVLYAKARVMSNLLPGQRSNADMTAEIHPDSAPDMFSKAPAAETITPRSNTTISDASSSAGNALRLRLNRRRGRQSTPSSASRHTFSSLSFLRRLSTVSLPLDNNPPQAVLGQTADGQVGLPR
ncbi:hypothetical protein SCP_0302650 [Sparassis crispa]|uniref:Uncharacterized protein n=1 Tax=Sparassis crispa TaxID=139825 RepID=A0A401GEF1_9APHY|nr:hypothetical protein SCP_0302650 [Sparassis crispa]GBE80550.1 hypothetical protein SCP_0302650 [Sparassis crispa]